MTSKLFPVYLIHGSLGAGKTTLVKKLAKNDYFKKSIVIENEFASENIDQDTLKDHFHESELFDISGGCICCTSGDELVTVLSLIPEKVKTIAPVIIETTGVASSAQLLKELFLNDAFHENYYLAKNILVLDALETNPEDLPAHALDIRLADLIILCKTDLVSEETTSKIVKMIEKIDAQAKVILAQDQSTASQIIEGKKSGVEHFLIENISEIADFLNIDHADQTKYKVVDMIQPISEKEAREYLKLLKKDGNIYRIKGNFKDSEGGFWHLEGTPNNFEIEPTTEDRVMKVVVIGKKIPSTILGVSV